MAKRNRRNPYGLQHVKSVEELAAEKKAAREKAKLPPCKFKVGDAIKITFRSLWHDWHVPSTVTDLKPGGVSGWLVRVVSIKGEEVWLDSWYIGVFDPDRHHVAR
jgi:hypothetical protein